MKISEEQLKELVLRVLGELEAERKADNANHPGQKLYMLCVSPWSDRYMEFLREMETSDQYEIVPVIPSSWKDMGYEARLMETKACSHILHRSWEKPADLETAITVMPVVPRDVLVKTALCISDTYETSWISECMDKGSRVVLLRSGLARFSGKEKPAYRNRVMNYYRQILEYGVEICSVDEFTGRAPYESPGHSPAGETASGNDTQHPDTKKKRVISSSNVEQFASGGVIFLQQGDIVTDLAKDRAKFLNIVFK